MLVNWTSKTIGPGTATGFIRIRIVIVLSLACTCMMTRCLRNFFTCSCSSYFMNISWMCCKFRVFCIIAEIKLFRLRYECLWVLHELFSVIVIVSYSLLESNNRKSVPYVFLMTYSVSNHKSSKATKISFEPNINAVCCYESTILETLEFLCGYRRSCQ